MVSSDRRKIESLTGNSLTMAMVKFFMPFVMTAILAISGYTAKRFIDVVETQKVISEKLGSLSALVETELEEIRENERAHNEAIIGWERQELINESIKRDMEDLISRLEAIEGKIDYQISRGKD